MSPQELRRLRGDRLSMVFQNPMTSLDPAYTIGFQIMEVSAHPPRFIRRGGTGCGTVSAAAGADRCPRTAIQTYPHHFSGGMRQRVVIAIALACNPALLIADEPTTALDTTIQAQILNLLRDLRTERRTSIILITHDLGVVAQMADRVAVMYAGRVVEEGPVAACLKSRCILILPPCCAPCRRSRASADPWR